MFRKKEKFLKKCYVFRGSLFSYEAGGFSWSLEVIHGDQRNNAILKIQFLS
jgi:hypothetical protein